MRVSKTLGKALGIRSRRERFQPTADALCVFYPGSDRFHEYPNLTFQSANGFPGQLVALLGDLGLATAGSDVDVESFPGADSKAVLSLADLFSKYGSDKHQHAYHFVYASILDRLGCTSPLRVLEVGIGTNNPLLVSTMGRSGRPGASLRAFRDYLPNAEIYGADVDRNVLFRESRISTAFVDQTLPESFESMAQDLGCSAFDLVVDDGLHSVEANINTLRFALRSIKSNGWIVIEDIPERTVVVWRVVAYLLSRAGIFAQIVKAKWQYLFVVTRKASP